LPRARERDRFALRRGVDVALEHLFQGSALNAVDAKGRVSVPAFLRSVIERRGDSRSIVLASHESFPCLSAYDPAYAALKHSKLERLLEKEETNAQAQLEYQQRNLMAFAATEEVPYDSSGRIVLPPMMRGKGEPAPQQPWEGAEGLEWEVPSPAPFHTFETPPMLNNAGTKIVGAKVPPHIDESSVGIPA